MATRIARLAVFFNGGCDLVFVEQMMRFFLLLNVAVSR